MGSAPSDAISRRRACPTTRILQVGRAAPDFRVTEQLQVIDVFGAPIAGLYAAGDCVGALGPLADLGGMHICGGLTFGRLAGFAAARAEHATGRRAAVFGSFMPDRIGERMPLVDLGGAR